MEILYDHQMFCLQRLGGITRVFVELIRELSRCGACRIHWYRGCHIDRHDIGDFRDRLARYWALPHQVLGRDLSPWLNRIGFASFRVTSGKRFDIYHPTYYDSRFQNTVRARSVALTVHDMILEKYLADLERFQSVIAAKRAWIQRADVILVYSRSTRDDLVDMMNVDSSKIRITPLGSRIAECEARPLPGEIATRPYFLYVGTRSKYKNFETLVRAYGKSNFLRENCDVICFGGTGPFVDTELREQRALGIEKNFTYLSGDDALLKSLYERAIALVYTSRYEGFGLPALEAMQCGCPVICGPHSSLVDVVGEAGIFFDVDSDESLRHEMESIAQSDALRNQCVVRGREEARRFSWQSTADATLAAYRSVCDG